MAQHIIVKHEDLHPEVKKYVKDLLAIRGNRVAGALGAAVPAPIAAGIGGFLAREASSDLLTAITPSTFFTSKEFPIATAGIAGLLAFGGYKVGSMFVRDETVKLEKKIQQTKVIDAKGMHRIAELRKTHPFAIVTRKGDIVLIPKTKFQEALAASQKTFLNHITPGRQRIRL